MDLNRGAEVSRKTQSTKNQTNQTKNLKIENVWASNSSGTVLYCVMHMQKLLSGNSSTYSEMINGLTSFFAWGSVIIAL